LRRLNKISFDSASIVTSVYRPFTKHYLYFSRQLNEYPSLNQTLYPSEDAQNVAISVAGVGANKTFSALIANRPVEFATLANGQCFPLYYFEKAPRGDMLDKATEGSWVRRDAITDAALAAFRHNYRDQRVSEIGKEDFFYYVYGILHSLEYKQRFESDLKKQLPRIPFASDFWAFSKAGRELAKWHLNYETVEPYPLKHAGELPLGDAKLYRVQKMAWVRKRVNGKLTEDKTALVYNSRLTLTGIPAEALEYVVNGKTAIEWVMERYQVTTDKDSGIVNDPNDWATEHKDPNYIFDLVKRVVRVSVETVRIVKALPALDEK
jgi:predicted helicase